MRVEWRESDRRDCLHTEMIDRRKNRDISQNRGREEEPINGWVFQNEQTAYHPSFPQRTCFPTAAPSWECTHKRTQTHIETGCLDGGRVQFDSGKKDSDGEGRRGRE